MPIPSAFHSRTSVLCESMRWKDWAGYFTVCSYDTNHDREYFAFRHGAGLVDVSPLFKYEIQGQDATAFLNFLSVKEISKLKSNQVTYCCWCNEEGKVIDDGTVTRWEENHYFVTAAEPSLAWFLEHSRGFKVDIKDISSRYAILSIQGPHSREILKHCTDVAMDELKFFYASRGKIAAEPVIISRTGYTGDLGFEIWCDWEKAEKIWDEVYGAGRPYGAEACGMDAMDVTRIEAGFIMNGVDYRSANHCLVESRKSTPFELNLGWTVNLDRKPFIGQDALKKEKKSGPQKKIIGLDIDWLELENLYTQHGLPPEICTAAWRKSVPVYGSTLNYVGYATSGAWSPTLKKNLALAHVSTPYTQIGGELLFEVLVEHRRHHIKATVVETPFFNPARKRSLPVGEKNV